MADHPIRTAAAATSGLVTGTLLEQIVKRIGIALGPLESLSDIDSDTGEIPLCVHHAGTGFVYFYDDSDTTTLDDGLNTLVDGSGRRYHRQDSASISLNSVLSRTNTPPGSPTVGDTYIVGTSPTGAWASNANDVAVYTVRGWIFASPSIGLSLYNQDDSAFWLYDETPQWVSSNPLVVADGEGVYDSNGNELLLFSVAAGAVNYAEVANAATGNPVEIRAKGSDTDVDLKLVPQADGKVDIDGIKWPNADGSSGQTLVTNGAGVLSWGSAGGRKRLAEKTASASSSLDFTEFDNTIYDGYEFTLYDILPAADDAFALRTSANAGSSYASGTNNYDSYTHEMVLTTPGGYRSQSTALRLSANHDVESTGAIGLSGTIRVIGAAESGGYTQFHFRLSYIEASGGTVTFAQGVGFRQTDAITDAVRFLFDSQNIASGIITLDGLRNS